jgi:hypothetical protein
MAWLCDWIVPIDWERGQVLDVTAQLRDRSGEAHRLPAVGVLRDPAGQLIRGSIGTRPGPEPNDQRRFRGERIPCLL